MTGLPRQCIAPRSICIRIAVGAGLLLWLGTQPGVSRGTEPEIAVEGGTEIVRPPPEKPLPSQAGQLGSRIVITRAQFQESQKTVADVIADQPGVTLTRSGDLLAPAKITMRGSRTDQVLVIVDGVPQNTQTDNPADARVTGRQGVDLSQLDLADVESIEIVRGAASGLYGPDAAAGAIVIHTRRPRERAFSVDHGVGSGGYEDTGFSGAEPIGASTVTYTARNRVSDGKYVYFNPGATQTIGGTSNPCAQSLGGGYFVRKCDRTEISTATVALLQGAQRRIALDWQDYDRQGLGGIEDPQPFGRDHGTRTGLTYGDGTVAWNWLVAAAEVDEHRTSNETITSGVFANHHVEEYRAGELWWTPIRAAPVEPTIPPPAGEVPSGTPLDSRALIPGQQVRLGAGANSLTLRDEYFVAQRNQGWLAAQWASRWERTAVEASLREDAFSDVPDQGTWRLAANQILVRNPSGSSFGLKASTGTGYRPPSLYELHDALSNLGTNEANPNLKPEQSQSVDGGVFADWPDLFYGELIAFEQDYRNAINLQGGAGGPQLARFENINRTRSVGYEALATWKPTRGLTLSVNYTHTRAEILDNDALDPRANGNQVPGVPEERGALEMAWRRDRWSLYLKARSASLQYADAENTLVLKPYTVWDAGIAVPLPRNFDLTFDLRNLTNETYTEVDNYPAPGLQAFVTLRWRLGKSALPTAPPQSLPTTAPRADETPAGPSRAVPNSTSSPNSSGPSTIQPGTGPAAQPATPAQALP